MRRWLLVVMAVVAMALSGCEARYEGRKNTETLHVETCGSAERVGAGSCNAQIWKFGGGN